MTDSRKNTHAPALLTRLLLLVALAVSFLFLAAPAQGTPEDSRPLTIAMDANYPPFTVMTPGGKPTGLLVELWRLWGETTGRKVRFLATDWADSLAALRDGRADLHSGLFSNDARAKWLVFSEPIHEVTTALFVNPSDSRVDSLADLAGSKVGAMTGSYQADYLRDRAQGAKLVEYPSGQALVKGFFKAEVRAIVYETPAWKPSLPGSACAEPLSNRR